MFGLTHNRGRTLVAAAIAVGIAAIGVGSVAVSASDAKAAAKTRLIYMSAVEWKGSSNVSKEPYPTAPLPSGGGYESFAPGSPEVAGQPAGTWAVETYRFDTAVVAACQGERVVLKIFGVNGKEHVTTVPDFGKNFTIRRGQMSTVVFRVPKTGIFPIICVTHRPSHVADLVVLPC